MGEFNQVCEYCDNGNGESVFPYYGLAPHTHKSRIIGSTEFTGEIPENFCPDFEAEGLGTYTHCLHCTKHGDHQ